MYTIESAGLSDTGKIRKDNEDTLLVDDDMGLYVVADGMGGHRAGEVASQLVVDSIRDYIQSCYKDKAAAPSGLADHTLSPAANLILKGIILSNEVVHEAAKNNDDYHGMGSTVAVLYINDGTLVAANVGDSPIFLIHKGQIDTLSVMHTVVAEHKAANPEGADQIGAEYNHVLTRAMGTETTVEANICEVPFFIDDRLVISSDGLTDLVSPAEILATVIGHPPKIACQNLVKMANDRGGTDNITVIALQVIKSGNRQTKLTNLLSRLSRILRQSLALKKDNGRRRGL